MSEHSFLSFFFISTSYSVNLKWKKKSPNILELQIIKVCVVTHQRKISFHEIFKNLINCYVFERQEEREISIFHLLVHSQLPATARLGPGQNQEHRTKSGSPTWVPEPLPAITWDLHNLELEAELRF